MVRGFAPVEFIIQGKRGGSSSHVSCGEGLRRGRTGECRRVRAVGQAGPGSPGMAPQQMQGPVAGTGLHIQEVTCSTEPERLN